MPCIPFFGRSGENYIGSLQCGSGSGRDAYLQIKFGGHQDNKIEMIALKPVGKDLGTNVDPEELRLSIMEYLVETNNCLKTNYSIDRIYYIPNDSMHYDLYRKIPLCQTSCHPLVFT